MSAKWRMLQECRRLARPGARMAFFVISLVRAPADEHERSLLQRSGPPHPDAEAAYDELLERAGWNVLEHIDVTPEFTRCMAILLRETEARSAALAAIEGVHALRARLERRRTTLQALESGLLQREYLLAA